MILGAKWRVAGAVNLLVVFFCGEAFGATKLERIFKPDMLQVQVAFLEKITGPAKFVRSNGLGVETRSYQVDGCKVEAFVEQTTPGVRAVIRYGLELAPRCNIDFGPFLHNHPNTRGLTPARFAKGSYGAARRVHADCVSTCSPHGVEPTIDLIFDGFMPTNNVGAVLTIAFGRTRAGRDAISQLQRLMESREGSDYVAELKFNCDMKYDEVARKLFADVPVDRVEVGYASLGPDNECKR